MYEGHHVDILKVAYSQEVFIFRLKSPKKGNKSWASSLWMNSGQSCDLADIFGDWNQTKKLFEIKPLLDEAWMRSFCSAYIGAPVRNFPRHFVWSIFFFFCIGTKVVLKDFFWLWSIVPWNSTSSHPASCFQCYVWL